MNTLAAPMQTAPWPGPQGAASTGLWFMMAVSISIFFLLLVAYVMRLNGLEGYPLALPWQFMLSTALLALGSLALEQGRRSSALNGLRWGGACAVAFVLVQLWAWQALLAAQVGPAGNPAASFLYLLTAMHGLHVLGGLLAWWRCLSAWPHADTAQRATGLALCARFWHFLLLLWALLYATLSWLTPELVRAICGTR
jgi:cytochrome c oxidase subunit 3